MIREANKDSFNAKSSKIKEIKIKSSDSQKLKSIDTEIMFVFNEMQELQSQMNILNERGIELCLSYKSRVDQAFAEKPESNVRRNPLSQWRNSEKLDLMKCYYKSTSIAEAYTMFRKKTKSVKSYESAAAMVEELKETWRTDEK